MTAVTHREPGARGTNGFALAQNPPRARSNCTISDRTDGSADCTTSNSGDSGLPFEYDERMSVSKGIHVVVGQVAAVSDDFVQAVARLLPQLSGAPIPSKTWLDDVVRAESNTVLVARDATERIVGMTTLVTFPLASGIRAWIHDVVVDESVRGQGVGRALTRAALKEAERRGAWTVDLTTRPWREDANRLYESAGFEPRETRVYRLSLPANPMTKR